MKTKLITLIAVMLWLQSNAQSFNAEINSETKNATLLGKINKEALSDAPYSEWFTKNYDEYSPNSNVVDTLKTELSDYTITAFMGTWCGDSKRQVPRFYKILDAAEFPLERLTMVAVSRERDTYKQSPGGEEEGLNIHRVPTFIIYKDGQEVNRIVESPVTTMEEDLLQILQNNYTPNYHGVTLVNDLLTSSDGRALQKKQKKLIPKLKGIVKGSKELNTYSSVLFYAEKKEEAVIAARINTLLFPKEARTYVNLANKLYRADRAVEALENYHKALELDPENKSAKSGLETIEKVVSN